MTYGVTADQAARFDCRAAARCSSCSSRWAGKSQLKELLETIARHELVARFLDMESGGVTLKSGRWSDVLEFDGKILKRSTARAGGC